MSKRARKDDTTSPRPPKRPRAEHVEKAVVEEIHFARQLQDLLVFRQDGVQQLRTGIASFKAFLESILYHKDPDNRARQLSILREYLDTQKPPDAKDPEARPFLSPLWQALSFSVREGGTNDALTSSVASLLALLLKTLSSILDLSEYGLLFCRTVLRGDNLNSVKKCLDAPRHKDFVISPALRLLIEVVGFDGGVLAREVYKRREQTVGWFWVRKCLGMVKTDIPPEELHRRPAIRTLTVRYILSLLKYLHEGGKADVLQNGALCRALFQNIRDDPVDLVDEIFAVTEQHVLQDDELKRSAKAAVLAQQNLERVTAIATQTDDEHASASKAFAWLKAVCTKPAHGVLRHSGWYPSGTVHRDRRRFDDDTIDLGLDSIEWYDRDERPAVRNPILLSWLQTLHPWSNLQERALILACFESAPELVAAYFAEKEKSMPLEPKLSNTWVGYASFLFEVVQLPVPQCFGHDKDWAQLPPQTTIVIESILPRPLTQKVISRCLNQSSELITFFAVRILVLALQKLRRMRILHADGRDANGEQSKLWNEAAGRLRERFVAQMPPMKDAVATFRRIPDDDDHALQREAISRLIRLYYEVTPLEALEEPFDVSSALVTALGRAQEAMPFERMTELRSTELEHLLEISRHSPGMRWTSKQGGLEYSPVTMLLRLHAFSPKDYDMRVRLLHLLCHNEGVLGRSNGLEGLMAATYQPNILHDPVTWDFIDDCIARASRAPVKYLDELEKLLGGEREHMPGLVCAVFLEQAPFLVQREKNQSAMKMVEIFMTLSSIGADDESAENVGYSIALQRIRRLDGWGKQVLGLQQDTDDLLSRVASAVEVPLPGQSRTTTPTRISKEHEEPEVEPVFEPIRTESENHPELLKWAQKDLDLALEDGDISALVFCLCSKFPDVRTQSLAQLRKLENAIITSNLEDKDPVYVLLGELIETYERNYLPSDTAGNGPGILQYLGAAFVSAALTVQMQPTHVMYPKLNRFLNKDPEWRVHKLPTYWIQNTILSVPDSSSLDADEKAYWHEVRWVLDWIVDGLRTPADVEVLRRGGVFERFMALFSSPGVDRPMKEKVLELLWRACEVGEGEGANMLVKRCGVLGWLDIVKPSRGGVEGWLREEILDRIDTEAVEEWAGVEEGEL